MSGEAVSLFSKNRILDFDFNISFYFSAHCNILKQSEIALRLAPGANTMYRKGSSKKKKKSKRINHGLIAQKSDSRCQVYKLLYSFASFAMIRIYFKSHFICIYAMSFYSLTINFHMN